MSTAPKTSKAGRNLPAAIGVGVLLSALVVLSLIWNRWFFVALASVAILLAVGELGSELRVQGYRLVSPIVQLASVAILVSAYLWGLTGVFISLGASWLLIASWRLAVIPGDVPPNAPFQGYVRDVAASALTLLYIPFLASFAILLAVPHNGALLVISLVALTAANDIGGYATGVFLGRTPIAPLISPKKSWEGFAGSLVAQATVGGLLFYFVLNGLWWHGVLTGLVMACVATLGDFIESAFKRDLGIKDMGSLLPGHGGVMDRLDSLLPNAFAAWVLFGTLL